MRSRDDLLKKLKPILGSNANRLWLAAEVDSSVRRDVETLLAVEASQVGETFESSHPCFEPPPAKDSAGEYPLGTCSYAGEPLHEFALCENEWLQHIAIFGRTGSGKTNAAFHLIRGLIECRKPFLVLDWKRSYRDLTALWPEAGILVFTVGREVAPFRFNPLIPPPGTPPSAWAKKLIEILCHAFFLGEGVAYLLLVAIDSVYQRSGIYDEAGEGSNQPTFLDLQVWLEGYSPKGRQAQWMDSTMRLIRSLCFGEVSRVLNSKGDPLLPALLDCNAILELDALNEAEKTFLVESLLLWIHHYRLQHSEREIFHHAIFLEEAHHVLTRRQGVESVTDLILREIRELGEGLVLIDQHPSLVSIPALGNTNCTLAMSLKHRRDLSAVGEALLLETDERRFLGQLPVGRAIARLQSRWHKPFVLDIPLVPLRKGVVTDDMLREKAEGYSDFFGPGTIGDTVLRTCSTREKRRTDRNRRTAEEQNLLKDVGEHPDDPVVERYRRLGWSAYKGTKVKRDLADAGLVRIQNTTTPTGRVQILRLTDPGRSQLTDAETRPEPKRHGGLEHRLLKRRISELLREEGWTCAEEARIGGGQTVDILATKKGRHLVVEVETGKSDAVHNVRRALAAGFTRVLVVATSQPVQNRIESLVNRHVQAGDAEVRVMTLRQASRFLGQPL